MVPTVSAAGVLALSLADGLPWKILSTLPHVFFQFYIVRKGALKGIASALHHFMWRISPDGRMFLSRIDNINLYQLIGVTIFPLYPH